MRGFVGEPPNECTLNFKLTFLITVLESLIGSPDAVKDGFSGSVILNNICASEFVLDVPNTPFPTAKLVPAVPPEAKTLDSALSGLSPAPPLGP